MRKLMFIVLTLLVFTIPSFSQNATLSQSYTFTGSGTQPAIGIFGNGISLHRIQWQLVNGAASACAVSLQGSDDNSSWSTIIASQTCTSSGSTTYFVGNYGYVRVNLSSLTLTSARGLTVTWFGYQPAPITAPVFDTTSAPLQIMGGTNLFGGLTTNITTGPLGIAGSANDLFTVTSSPGIFVALTVSRVASTAGGIITCYDSASTATLTNKISLWVVSSLGQYVYNRPLTNGMVCQGGSWGATNPDITISYK